MKHKTIWNSITFIIAFDLLYNDFEILLAPLFYLRNKDLKKIYLIIIFTKTINIAKQEIDITRDLGMMIRKKRPL